MFREGNRRVPRRRGLVKGSFGSRTGIDVMARKKEMQPKYHEGCLLKKGR